MALLYRAIWQEDRVNLTDAAAESTLEWLGHKGLLLDQLPDGETQGEYFDPRSGSLFPVAYELSANRADVDGTAAVQIRLAEHQQANRQVWTTTLTALTNTAAGGTLWVDVERVSEDPFARVPFRAPVLVKSLIESGKDPRVGQVRLSSGPLLIKATGLAGLISNTDRRLPLVVFSHDRSGPQAAIERANKAYDRLAGVAQVFVLHPEDVDAFTERVGTELSVWGGGARLYLPSRGPGGLNPRRHRFIAGSVAARSPAIAADRFAGMLAATVPATPAPQAYESVRRVLRGRTDYGLDALLEAADEELRGKEAEIERLRGELANSEDEIIDLAADNEDLSAERNRLLGQIALMARHSGGSERASGEPAGLPDEVESVTEAIELAAQLPNVVIHTDAAVDIDKIEANVSAPSWANTLWRGLRALNAYAANEEAVVGGFYLWCRDSGSPWAWPSSDKKLAMTESDGVLNNQRLRAPRTLPVAPEVRPSGRIEMLAHLKIAQGGGPIAPRVYFHDDTGGATGKVHVGFIGPHEHMPNLSTN